MVRSRPSHRGRAVLRRAAHSLVNLADMELPEPTDTVGGQPGAKVSMLLIVGGSLSALLTCNMTGRH